MTLFLCYLFIYLFLSLQGLYKSLSSCQSFRDWRNFAGWNSTDLKFPLQNCPWLLPIFLKKLFVGFLIGVALQHTVGSDGKKKELESNVLLASIENMQYAVTIEVLHTVRYFSSSDLLLDVWSNNYNWLSTSISGLFGIW